MSQLEDETIGQIVTPVMSDGAAFFVPLCDGSGRLVALVGYDGADYQALKTNAQGQVEVLVSGQCPDADTVDGKHAADMVQVLGDTMTGRLLIQLVTEQLRLGYDADTYCAFVVDSNGILTATLSPANDFYFKGHASFGDSITAGSAVRALNLIDANGVMRIWRKHDSYGTSFELISSNEGSDVIDERWTVSITKAGVFGIRQRNAAGASVDIYWIYILANGNVGINETDPGAQHHITTSAADVKGQIIQGSASQSVDLKQYQDDGDVVLRRVNKDGYAIIRKTAAIADGDLAASEVALWFDDTDGTALLMIKGKSADGTVVSGSVALA